MEADSWVSAIELRVVFERLCDNTPSAPRYINFFETISILAGESCSGSDRGISHFFIATRNTIKGVGEKEQRRNEELG